MASCPKNSGTYPSTKNPGISDKTKWKFKESIQTNAGFIDWKNLIVQKKSEFFPVKFNLISENQEIVEKLNGHSCNRKFKAF